MLAPEITYFGLSLLAAYISFTIVQININFAYYFFFMTRVASKTSNAGYLEAKSEGRRFNFKTLVRLLYLQFFAPIIITFLFMQELTGSLVVQYVGIEQETWEVTRLGFVLLFMVIRHLTFREEL